MRSILLGAAAVLGLFPTVASAALALNVEKVQVLPSPVDQTVFVEIFGTDTAPVEDEQLFVYTITANGQNFAANGVRFVVPVSGGFQQATVKPQKNKYVFRDQGFEFEPSISNFGSTFNKLQFGADVIGDEDKADVDGDSTGFIRIPVLIPGGTTGNFPIVVDIGASQFGGYGAPITLQTGELGGVEVVPEPASLGLLVLGGLMALRRRRVA